jgi:hypothetical protein
MKKKKPILFKKINKRPAVGTDVVVFINKDYEKMTIRGRIDEKYLKKHNIGWGKVETEEQYKNYLSDMDWYAKQGYLYIKSN